MGCWQQGVRVDADAARSPPSSDRDVVRRSGLRIHHGRGPIIGGTYCWCGSRYSVQRLYGSRLPLVIGNRHVAWSRRPTLSPNATNHVCCSGAGPWEFCRFVLGSCVSLQLRWVNNCRLTCRSTRTSRMRGCARAAGRRLAWFVRPDAPSLPHCSVLDSRRGDDSPGRVLSP